MIHKKTIHWWLIGIGGGLIILDLLFYFAVLAPTQQVGTNQRAGRGAVLNRLAEKKAALNKLGGIQSHLKDAKGTEVDRFSKYLWDASDGFSGLIQFLNDTANRHGIQKGRTSFKTANQQEAGLLEVRIDLPMEGTYTNVVQFINSLERCDRLLVIDGIVLQSGQDNPGAVRLTLSILTYVKST